MAHGPEKRGKQDVSRVLFTTAGTDPAVGVIICLGPPLPAASSGAGGTERDDDQPLFRGPKPGLAPGRGLPSRHLSMPLVRSYRTFAPLPVRAAANGRRCHRRCVSVALSSRSPAPGVTRQAWPSGSPDFPQPAEAPPRPKPAVTSPIAITSPAFPGAWYAVLVRSVVLRWVARATESRIKA